MYNEIAYMKVVYHSSYRKAGTLSWTDQSSDIPDYKYMIQIPQSSMVSQVSLHLVGSWDRHNKLRLKKNNEQKERNKQRKKKKKSSSQIVAVPLNDI